MATFKKRGDKWQAQVRRKGHDAQVMVFRLKSDAEKWARGVESDMERSRHFPMKKAETTTLAVCLERYKMDVTPRKKSASKEAYVINQMLRHPLAARPMAEVDTEAIASYRDERLRAGMSPSTVVRALMLFSNLFNRARTEWGMKSLVNPVTDVQKPSVEDARDRRLLMGRMSLHGQPAELVSELDAIAANTKSRELAAIARLAGETAMRRSEIFALTWDKVRLNKRTIAIPDSKNGSPRRIPLTTRAVAILEGVPRVAGDARVFTMTVDSVSRAFARARDRARALYLGQVDVNGDDADRDGFLVGLRFHDLRHEATSTLSKHITGLQLARVTGHKDPRMVLRYLHPDPEELARLLP